MDNKKLSSVIDKQDIYMPFTIMKSSSVINKETTQHKKYIDNTESIEEQDDIVVDILSSTLQRKLDFSTEMNGSSITSTHNNIYVDENDIEEFISLVDFSCLESGYTSDAERFIMSLCKEKGYPYIIYMMNELYAKHIDNELLMCALMNIMSHIDYKDLQYPVISFCMAMIANGTPLMWEYVINACDSWNNIDFVKCLERINTDSMVLKRMIKKVIKRITRSNGRL